MEKERNLYDVAKEASYLLTYFDLELVEKIPNDIRDSLNELSKMSNKFFYIDSRKSLEEQKISEEAKDLISLIYYKYISSEEEQKSLIQTWNSNELSYQERNKQKYTPNQLF